MAKARTGSPMAQGKRPALTLKLLLSHRAQINTTIIKRLKIVAQLNLGILVPLGLTAFWTEGCPLSLFRFCHFLWKIG
jgi:hypothetical protein